MGSLLVGECCRGRTVDDIDTAPEKPEALSCVVHDRGRHADPSGKPGPDDVPVVGHHIDRLITLEGTQMRVQDIGVSFPIGRPE